jgi:hypothetical protein
MERIADDLFLCLAIAAPSPGGLGDSPPDGFRNVGTTHGSWLSTSGLDMS